ncbi:MAG: helix-turn-helix domain-containing protein [Nocardioides sp.]
MTTTAKGPRTAVWPLWLLALPAFVAVWSGWVGLGRLCGFGVVQPLPGIVDGFELNTAVTLPIGMEAYAAYALRVWLTSTSPVAVRFARRSTIAALTLGAAGQVVYHVLTAAGATKAPVAVTALVAVLPVAVLGMGATLAHLVTSEHSAADQKAAMAVRRRRVQLGDTESRPVAADRVHASAVTGRRGSGRSRPSPGRAPGGVPDEAAVLLASEPALTTTELAARLNVSERTARRYRAATYQHTDTTTTATAGTGRDKTNTAVRTGEGEAA